MERWLADIATAQSLKLDGADCYQLNVYRNTPLAKAIESGRLPAGADVPMQSAMFAAGVKAMQKGFYRRLSISHWARTSRERIRFFFILFCFLSLSALICRRRIIYSDLYPSILTSALFCGIVRHGGAVSHSRMPEICRIQ